MPDDNDNGQEPTADIVEPNVLRAFAHIEQAAQLYDYAGLLYLLMGMEAAKLGEPVPAQFSLAQAMAQFATAARVRANAELQVANIVNLGDAIVLAVHKYNQANSTDSGGDTDT